MADFTLRRAELGDEYILALIGASTFLDGFLEIIPGPALVAHCQAQHNAEVYRSYLDPVNPKTACWLAEHAVTGAPIGYALNCAPTIPGETGASDVELKRIYCMSRVHGSGAGQALMTASIAHARSLSAKRLWLGTYEQNHRAIAFYKRNGFTTVGTRQFQVGDQMFDDIVMSLVFQ
ncbi:MAG: GNAT family N-acetyltransferase [Pseudomonadota bacterium]